VGGSHSTAATKLNVRAQPLPHGDPWANRSRSCRVDKCVHAVPIETYEVPVKTAAGVVTVRPLRNGDMGTVRRVFERLGERARRLRFGWSKPVLTPGELELLARVDADRHVLVAYAQDAPIGITHLVRDAADRRSAEVASVVADDWQQLGVGTALTKLAAGDAAAAGIRHVHAAVRLENCAALSLMAKATRIVGGHLEAGQLHLVALT
jgi:ribosomal protein S18 acetylase RimI-like enzyme